MTFWRYSLAVSLRPLSLLLQVADFMIALKIAVDRPVDLLLTDDCNTPS